MSKKLTVLATLCLSLVSLPARAETQSFEQALASAYQSNPSLQAQRARLRAVDEQVSQALSNWRPSADATAEIGKSSVRVEGSAAGTQTTTPRDVGITVTQPLFRGFRTLGAVRAAEAQVKAARATLQDAEQQLLLDAAKAYLDVVQYQTTLDITRNNEDVLQKQLEATQDRFNAGTVTKTDVSQSEARLNAAVAQRIQAEGDLANRRATFARLIGDAPGKLKQPALKLDDPQNLDEAITQATHRNPSVIAADFSQQAAKEDVTSAEGSLLPEISLVGKAARGWDQSPAVTARQDSGSLMARMTIPLYRAGTDYSKTRAAQQTVVQKRMELEEARNKAREAATTAWQALMTAKASKEANKAAVTANDLALQGVRVESKVGSRTTLDVLNAEQELLNAKLNLVKAERDEALATLQVRAAIGELTAGALKLPVAGYDPTQHYNSVRDKWLGFGDDGN